MLFQRAPASIAHSSVKQNALVGVDDVVDGAAERVLESSLLFSVFDIQHIQHLLFNCSKLKNAGQGAVGWCAE